MEDELLEELLNQGDDFDILLNDVVKKKGGTKETYMNLLNKIAYHESAGTMNPSIKQYGGGPGRGKYQFENSKGSNRILTSANRVKRYYKSIGAKVPKFVQNIINRGTWDASTLDGKQQDILALGDLASKKGVNLKDYAQGKVSTSDLWAKHWWAGNKKDRQKRIDSFNNSMIKYNTEYPQEEVFTSSMSDDFNRLKNKEYEQSINKVKDGVFVDVEAPKFNDVQASNYNAEDDIFKSDFTTFLKNHISGIDSNQKAKGGFLSDPPPTKDEQADQTGKDFVSNWMSHPETRKRYRANMNEYQGTNETNLGVDNEKFRNALINIKNTKSNFNPSTGDGVSGMYHNQNIKYFGKVNPGTSTHEYTHATEGIDKDMTKYAMKKYGLLGALRDKHPGLNTNEAVQKEFNINGSFGVQDRIKHASYMGRNGELYPRFMEMRQFLNVTPGQPITDEMVDKLMKDEKTSQAAKYYKPEQLKEILNTIASNDNISQYQNVAAYGGKLNSDSNNKNSINEFNNGGLHEHNPYGGIPQGTGSNGKMNTVEEGETSFDIKGIKYIFSNRLKL